MVLSGGSYTQHPAPYTLHPKPYTPNTLHHKIQGGTLRGSSVMVLSGGSSFRIQVSGFVVEAAVTNPYILCTRKGTY